MSWRRLCIFAMLAGAVIGLALSMPSIMLAQDDGGGGDTFNFQAPPIAGVWIDAAGVLQTRVFRDPAGRLTRQRLVQAKAALNEDLARPSKLRKISLNRLEAAVAQRLAQGVPIPEEMRYLAGLTRVRNVFFYPETGDIVLAGPAEGFMQDLSGRVIGIATGRAILQLEDLVVALRAFSPTGNRANVISVSIDPTKEGLARMQKFLRYVGSRATPRDTQRIVQGLGNSLGLQTVSIRGISPKTHFARVLVEADYRMKLIGIGLEIPAVKITSYVQRANPAAVSRNAMQRWYFMPNYECVRVSDDQLAMELVGNGVKLVGQNELVNAQGGRVASQRGDRASQLFVNSFTKKYPELARRSPVYAELRNLIDMSIAAAFIQQHDFYGRASWTMEIFGSEEAYPVEVHEAPVKVATAVNAIWKGRTLMTPIGGGVNIQPRLALNSDQLLSDEDGKVEKLHDQIDLSKLAEGQWWWD